MNGSYTNIMLSFLKAWTEKMSWIILKRKGAIKLPILISSDQIIPYNVALQQSVYMLHLMSQNYKIIENRIKIEINLVNLHTSKNGQPYSGLDTRQTHN